MKVKNFKCNITNYEIELYYDEEYALINNIKTDHIYMKSLILLLKNMINWINVKNIKIIKQYVSLQDYNEILKNLTTFEIESNENEILLIKCKQEEFLDNYCKATGIIE